MVVVVVVVVVVGVVALAVVVVMVLVMLGVAVLLLDCCFTIVLGPDRAVMGPGRVPLSQPRWLE